MPLESIFRTEELNRRAPRQPDYASENLALVALTRSLADAPDTILQTLAESILDGLKAGSAGVSLLTENKERFYWPAIAGLWEQHIGGGTPRNFSPCGDVLDSNAPLLLAHIERRYTYFEPVTPPVEECLLVPFYVVGKAVGTIWAVAHDALRKFDSEDLRQLQNLGLFASAAYQAQAMAARDQRHAARKLDDALQTSQALEQHNVQLLLSANALQRSEAELRDFVEHASVGLHWVGPDGSILWANQTELDLLGYTREEYIGHNITEFHVDRPVIEDMLVRLTGGETLHDHEARMRCKDGSIRHVVVSSNAYVEGGKFVHTRCFTHDITDRKHAAEALRASEEFNRSIVNSSPDCIKVLTLEGNLLSMLSGQALLGIEDIRPFLNKSWVDFWEGDDRQAAQTAVNAAATGAAGHFVGFFRTFRGESKWWDVAITPLLDATGKPERLLSVSRDVTQRRLAELNLAFLAGVSHDLVLWTNVDEMMRIVGAKIAAHFKLSSCAFVEINAAADQVEIRHEWHREDIPSLVGVHRLGDFVGEEFIRLARAGETIVVRNTDNDARTSPEKFDSLKIAAFICEPLIRDDQWRFALCLYHSTPYDWREDEIALARELTARIWTRLERLRAETALSASEAQYRNVFNSMDQGLSFIEMIFDEQDNPVDFLFLDVNASYENQTGMNNVTGKRVRDLLPDIEPYWIELYGKIALTGEPARYVNVAKGLGDRWFDVYAFRIGGPGTKKIAVLFTNITERRKTEGALRQSEARFRALFDRGPIGMYSCDLSGKTVAYNRVAVELWGSEPKPGESDEQIRSSFQLFLTDGTPLAIADTPMSQVLQGKAAAVHDQQIMFARPDGSRITMVSNIVPLKNERGEITGAIDCFYDITERSLLEKKTFEQAEALTDLHRRKDEFLAMLSHELRNPLAPISNAVHLLRMQKNEDPIQQQARSIIERQVGQLTHLIDDLMEVSRITTGRIHLHEENIALRGVLENAVETVRPLIDKHRHSLKLSLSPTPIWLHADAARLEQVVVNLLTNAVKYTDRDGTIALSLVQDEDEAVIRVKDTGVGISAELLPRIFDLFTQADRSLDRSQGGLGIGLCLVKRLVEMHRGTVTVQSTVGKGSEFEVRLPVVKDSALLPAVATTIPLTTGEVLRVLIVEDNLDAAETLTMLLELSGHSVRATNTGLAALQVALLFRPHVVLLDIGLPGMDGFAVAKQLRTQPALAGIVLVAMTGYGEVLARKRSREAGFDHHLVKPADFGKVQEILASVSNPETLKH